jgi:hypothetical protein
VRLEGYLPKNDFQTALRNGLRCISFVHKKYSDAERCTAKSSLLSAATSVPRRIEDFSETFQCVVETKPCCDKTEPT